MFKIYKGGDYFYQWDLGQRLVMDEPFVKVHFCNQTTDCALVCETYEEDGVRLVNVPNVLLQTVNNIRVYGCYEETEDICYSTVMQIFRVIARGKPDSYVYTETEVLNYEKLEKRIEELEAKGGGGAVFSVNGQVGDVVLSAADVNAYTKEETNNNISGAIDTNIGILRDDIANEFCTKEEVNNITGDIETALDNIIAIQNELLEV